MDSGHGNVQALMAFTDADQAVRRNEKLIRGLTAEELKVLSRVIEKLEANAMSMLASEPPEGA